MAILPQGPGAIEPSNDPRMPNWKRSLLSYWATCFPSQNRKQSQAQVAEANTGQLGNAQGAFMTKLRAAQLTPNMAPNNAPLWPVVTPVGRGPKETPPWPMQTAVGDQGSAAGSQGPAGRVVSDGRTLPKVGPQAQRVVPHQIGQPYNFVHSATDPRRRDLIPVGGPHGNGNLDYGPAPWRVPQVKRFGVSSMAGLANFSGFQWNSGIKRCLVLSPVAWSNPTRGVRSASGAYGRVQSSGGVRIPAVFVPRQTG